MLIRVLRCKGQRGIGQLACRSPRRNCNIHRSAPLRDGVVEIEHREQQVRAVPLFPRPRGAASRQCFIECRAQAGVLQTAGCEIGNRSCRWHGTRCVVGTPVESDDQSDQPPRMDRTSLHKMLDRAWDASVPARPATLPASISQCGSLLKSSVAAYDARSVNCTPRAFHVRSRRSKASR